MRGGLRGRAGVRGMWIVLKRELKGYFLTPLAYVFLVIFLFLSSFITFQQGFFQMKEASMWLFFTGMPWLFIFFAPALAMRLWAEERRTNSIELLFTLPLTVTQAVLGKFFAAWAMLVLALVLTCPMVFTVMYLGHPDPGPIAAGYLGSIFLAGLYLAIGSFFSALTRNQVIAFILGALGCGLFFLAGSPYILNILSGVPVLSGGFLTAMENLSVQNRFESLLRGVIEVRDVLFFLLLIGGWMAATIAALKERMAMG